MRNSFNYEKFVYNFLTTKQGMPNLKSTIHVPLSHFNVFHVHKLFLCTWKTYESGRKYSLTNSYNSAMTVIAQDDHLTAGA